VPPALPPTLVRDLDALSAQPADLLVIGGGIYGLTIAADAAQRGLAVVLVERGDFGSGTSFNHLRTIHGGLRYLQTLDIPRARESVRERRTLARIAPWAVRPLPFVLPLYRSITKGPLAMRAGFLLDRLVAHDRNEGVPPSHRLPAGRVLSRAAAQQRYSELRLLPLIAAALWYDYVTVDADRLTLSWALSAATAGARLANYVEATALRVSNRRVTGAEFVDRLTGREHVVSAGAVINATGSRVDQLLAPHGASTRVPMLQAVNLVTTRPGPAAAIGGRSASGRNLFLVPWRGRALFGTWESPTLCGPDDLHVPDTHVDAFLAELNEAFPGWDLSRADVALVHRGVVPAKKRQDGSLALEGGELVFEHTPDGLDGLISVAGTKYTTARAVAERIVDRVCARLGRQLRCASMLTPLPQVALDGDALLRHAARHEMVQTLGDAVKRRTPLGVLGRPDKAQLAHAAAVVGAELGWPVARQAAEVDALERDYLSA